jgi:Ca2+-binding RTX toxin-like protein
LADRFVEVLEPRRLLAITAEYAGGVLTFTGDANDNALAITASDNTSTSVSFASSTDSITLIGGTSNPQGGVALIVIDMGGGNVSLVIIGSAGADTIASNALIVFYATVAYAHVRVEHLTIDGQGGADNITATGVGVGGTMQLLGGAGGDTLSVANSTTGALVIDGGADNDAIELLGDITVAAGPANRVVNAGTGDDVVTIERRPGSTLRLNGGGGSDRLVMQGTPSADTVHVFATQIHQDVDTLVPEVIYVQIEELQLDLRQGNDVVSIQLPVSPLETLPALIRVAGHEGSDRVKVTGTQSSDVIRVSTATVQDTAPFRMDQVEVVQVFGLGGDDFIQNETRGNVPLNSLLDGGFGNDRLIGSIGSDILFGGGGTDWLQGGPGHDLLYADYDFNFGNPVQVASNYDKLDGGTGFDILMALAIDVIVQETPGDTSFDRVVGNRFGLGYSPTFQADFLEPTVQNINATLQLRLNLPAGYPF